MSSFSGLCRSASLRLSLVVAPWAWQTGAAYAQPAQALVAEHGSQLIEQQQLERLREDRRRARREPPPNGEVSENVSAPVDVPVIDSDCRPIKTIGWHGDSQWISPDIGARIQQDFVGRCLGTAELENLLALLTEDFVGRGLVTTRAYLPAQDLAGGRLEIEIVAGVIERYELEGGSDDAVWLAGVFPAKPGELLNLRDLEQGMEQINRLRSNRALLELRPGSAPGQTVVVVKNTPGRPVRMLAAYDNEGADATGRHSVSAMVTFDRLLGWNEQLSLMRRQTAFPFDGPHRSEATSLRAQVPLGYRTLLFDFSQTSYVNTLSLPLGAQVAVEGRTQTYGFGIDHVVYRDQRSRVTASYRLAAQSSRTWVDDILLEVGSRRLAFANVGVDASRRMWGGVVFGRVDIVQGLNGFGAMRDAPALARGLPHAQFTKLTYELGHAHNVALGSVPLTISTQFRGQFARMGLYGSQQFLIGGPTSVRGFLNNALSGDSGLLIRTEVGLPWRTHTAYTGALGGRVYAGFDWGRVSSVARGATGGALSGVAVGVEMSWRACSLNVQLSRATSAPSPRMREGFIFGMRVAFDI